MDHGKEQLLDAQECCGKLRHDNRSLHLANGTLSRELSVLKQAVRAACVLRTDEDNVNEMSTGLDDSLSPVQYKVDSFCGFIY